MRGYISIYRPLNLLFIGLAQYLAAYRLDLFATMDALQDAGLYYIIAATLATAALGYWTNDYYDKERDQVNKPKRTGILNIPNWLFIIHIIAFVVIIILLGLQISLFYLGIFLSTACLLWVYSMYLKDTPGMGNAIIAFLSFLSIYMLRWRFSEIDPLLLIHFAVLAGFLNLCREIVKDAEDMEGDRQMNAKTIPLTFGLKFSNRIVYFILLFTISFVAISLYYQKQYFKAPVNYIYWAYYFLFVIVPLYRLAVRIRFDEDATDYSEHSKVLKYVLYTGILSILFF